MTNQKISIIKNMEIPVYYFNNKFEMKHYEKFPIASYDNGAPCFLVNMYLQSPDVIKLSFESILKKAYALSNLISFCENHNIKFKEFNETTLFKFANFLKQERNPRKPEQKARNNNAINYILKTTLYFFDFIGEQFFNEKNYCINILNAKKISKNIKLKDRVNSVESSGLHHRCFVQHDPLKKRSPISQQDIDKLHESIPKISNEKYIQHRTSIMLKILEITGARVGEISNLKIDDIEEAYKQEQPFLKMKTLKKQNQRDTRLVPVEKLDLKEIVTFIKIHRSKVIRKTIGKQNDHKFLFINNNTGKPLEKITISNEINKLKKLSGIENQTCAHMFRHRYITRFFIKLIKQYDLENKNDFRNALIDINSLKVHIQQVTGHTNVNSLDHYIDLAKDELSNIDTVLKKVNDSNYMESIQREEHSLLRKLENGEISIQEYSNSLKAIKK